jgi:hypothetical protein
MRGDCESCSKKNVLLAEISDGETIKKVCRTPRRNKKGDVVESCYDRFYKPNGWKIIRK